MGYRGWVMAAIAMALALSQSAGAVGVSVKPSELSLSVSRGGEAVGHLVVKNPSRDVALFEVYPDSFESMIRAAPASFVLESGAEREVVILVTPDDEGRFSALISVAARSLADSSFSAGGGVKIPIAIEATTGGWLQGAVPFRQLADVGGLDGIVTLAFWAILLVAAWMIARRSAALAVRLGVGRAGRARRLILASVAALVVIVGGGFTGHGIARNQRTEREAAAPAMSASSEQSVARQQSAVPAVSERTAQEAATIIIDFGDGTPREYAVDSSGTATLFLILRALAASQNIPFEFQNYAGLGAFVTRIGDFKNGANARYWQYWVNGRYADVGASSYDVHAGDTINWRFIGSNEQ